MSTTRSPRPSRVRAAVRVGTVTALALAAWTGTADAQEAEITAESVQANLDNVFVLLAGVLVIFMQAGFALVEAGLTRAKSVANIMMKNLMDFSLGAVAFFAVGFAIAFGAGNDFLGTSGFFLSGGGFDFGTLTIPTFFLFQVAFAATAATIVSGAMAERTRFKSYAVYSVGISALIYPVVVHWVWGGGWLSQLATPFVDFAGSTVVHSVGGWAALMGAIILGPRIGKFGKDGRPRALPGHSTPFVVLGTLILLVGWYGFNPGSQLAADGAIGGIAVTTTLAAAAGAVLAMVTIWLRAGKPDVGMAANGMLAGLVGITAGCAAVSNVGALAIGATAGVIVVFSVLAIERLRIDDPVGAISVHGVCGLFGTLAVGLFATDGGLFYGGGASQLVSQAIGAFSVMAWVLVTAGILFTAIKATIGLRVPEEEEIAGLDVVEHGSPGYPEWTPSGSTGTGMAAVGSGARATAGSVH